MVEGLGARIEPADRVPQLFLDEQAVADGRRRLETALELPPEATVVALHPGSQKPSRRWPTERFAALAVHLLERRPDLRLVFTGTPAEADLVATLRASLPTALRDRARSAIGQTNLHSLVGLLDRSAAFVCNDTGVMHLARARGTPLLALLGPENDRRWGPYPGGSAPAVAPRHIVPCAPCSRWDCEALYCLQSLNVEEVAAELDRLLDGGRRIASEPGTLDRRLHRHDWSDLAASGFSTPTVGVVLFEPPLEASASEPPIPIDDRLAALAQQDYPDVQGILVVRPDAVNEPMSSRRPWSGGLTVVRPERDDPATRWRAVLEASRADLFALAPDAQAWHRNAISSSVAAWTRDPDRAISPYLLRREDLERRYALPRDVSGPVLARSLDTISG